MRIHIENKNLPSNSMLNSIQSGLGFSAQNVAGFLRCCPWNSGFMDGKPVQWGNSQQHAPATTGGFAFIFFSLSFLIPVISHEETSISEPEDRG
ncbi:hypothetical protein D623_10022980 [Myotis brandtii]|uniref:Uncharacterized protein n=1 Tax=Myotis brandtii TaxID=109478 RepID=S7N0S8_MYOBR|nr:hypothetical protein D623_10022980 [Myotis brandtii]